MSLAERQKRYFATEKGKECRRKAWKKWRESPEGSAWLKEYNKRKYREDPAKAVAAVKQRRQEMRERFLEYKSGLSCPCGESRPPALDFHHRDPSQKSFNVSYYLARGWGWARILEEISKCDVLCANCHRVLEAEKKSQDAATSPSDTKA